MNMISGVLGAFILFILYYAAAGLLEKKLSLQLPGRKVLFLEKCITDPFVLGVGILTFAAWCYLGSREGAYQNIFETLQSMILLLAVSLFAVTDAKAKRIPNFLVLLFLALWPVVSVGAMLRDFGEGLALTGQSLIGGAAGGLIFLMCYLLSRGQLGAGDVKLAFVMGLYLTGQRIVGAIAYGVLLCCVYSLIQMARKKLTMRDGVPLAPFLYLGTLITFLLL